MIIYICKMKKEENKNMKKIIVTVGDDNNSQYRKEVELEVTTSMYYNLKECGDEYDECWDRLCDKITYYVDDLPRSWFINSIKYC